MNIEEPDNENLHKRIEELQQASELIELFAAVKVLDKDEFRKTYHMLETNAPAYVTELENLKSDIYVLSEQLKILDREILSYYDFSKDGLVSNTSDVEDAINLKGEERNNVLVILQVKEERKIALEAMRDIYTKNLFTNNSMTVLESLLDQAKADTTYN